MTFHILEGTVFKIIPLSFFFFLKKIKSLFLRRNKNLFGLYLGEGSENRPFEIFVPSPWATSLRPRSQIWKGLFSKPSPI
jgi:hypothetical protein